MKNKNIEYANVMSKYNNDKIERMKSYLFNVDNDSNKGERLAEQLCKYCFYQSSKIVLQAFTDFDCLECGETMTFANSDTDKYCYTCAYNNNLCKHCGGYM